MPTADEPLVYPAIVDKDGLKVSKSPWGPDDEIGRLNWITPESNKRILESLNGSACSTWRPTTSSACPPGRPPATRRTTSG